MPDATPLVVADVPGVVPEEEEGTATSAGALTRPLAGVTVGPLPAVVAWPVSAAA